MRWPCADLPACAQGDAALDQAQLPPGLRQDDHVAAHGVQQSVVALQQHAPPGGTVLHGEQLRQASSLHAHEAPLHDGQTAAEPTNGGAHTHKPLPGWPGTGDVAKQHVQHLPNGLHARPLQTQLNGVG